MTNEALRLLTIKETSGVTRLSEGTIRNLIRCGALDSVKIGSCRRIRAGALEKYLSGLAA
jgi:excisionase family DNA binding protein